jgi:hypothetical protein
LFSLLNKCRDAKFISLVKIISATFDSAKPNWAARSIPDSVVVSTLTNFWEEEGKGSKAMMDVS